MREFYPPIEAYDSGRFPVSDLHQIYYEQAGNPEGVPVVFLHGGPGGGISPDHRRYFDPDHYRVILFDQRGCGQSLPHAELKENTTWDLVSDINKLTQHLGVSRFHLFGGSWGSTLALSFAVTHPDKVLSLMLRGIFLCRPSEIHWFYQEGASHIFPDLWEPYAELIAPEKRSQMVQSYYELLTHSDEKIRLEAATRWSQWEAGTARLVYDKDSVKSFEDPHLALAFARIECHYFINNAFFEGDRYLLDQCAKIAHLPCQIVQGRYDVICPVRSAWELHKALPLSKLTICPQAGHAGSEPEIRSALIETTDAMRQIR